MNELGLTAKSVESIVLKKEWVQIYRTHLDYNYSNLHVNEFPENTFMNLIKPQLIITLKNDFENALVESKIRKSLQKWTLLAGFKSYYLIRLKQLIAAEILEHKEIQKKFSDIPRGPTSASTIDKMSPENQLRWHIGNILITYKESSVTNLLGNFVSEQFFTLEAFCRSISIGSCLEFALKSILPNVVIQHDEIHKTLKKLGTQKNDRISCKMCPINEKCVRNKAYSNLADIYALYYHLRVIKDYKIDYLRDSKFENFLLEDFLNKSFKITCEIEKIENKIYSDYWFSPFSLEKDEIMINDYLKL